MTLTKKLTKIQTEFKSKKSRYNSFGKYYFRSAEDILEATKPFLKELEVTVTVHEELVSFDPPVMQVTAKLSDGKDTIESQAVVGVDTDQKGMQMPQRYGAASSYGKKYALGNLFLIDDTQDSDATNTHDKSKSKLTDIIAAKNFIINGGKVDAIKKKYQLTKEQEQELTTL
tara:strand:+ start:1433 stop:1948 length:516 start_codon:yes stop_codon:yes gene_type:complete